VFIPKFAAVAFGTQRLKVGRVIRATIGPGNDVVALGVSARYQNAALATLVFVPCQYRFPQRPPLWR